MGLSRPCHWAVSDGVLAMVRTLIARRQGARLAGLREMAHRLLRPISFGRGVERVNVTLAQALAARGIDVDVVVARGTGPYFGELNGKRGSLTSRSAGPSRA